MSEATIKSPEQIEKMARAGRVLSECLDLVTEAVCPGMTTESIDKGVEEFILEAGAEPTFKGYKGYPASSCTSVNDVVVHGIPGAQELKSGDLLSVDVGVTLDGWVVDGAISIAIGEASDSVRALIKISQRALVEAIQQARPGGRIGDISAAIEGVAREAGVGIIRDFVGHGIGRSLHEDPDVPNVGSAGEGPEITEGMVFAIEPMFCLGDGQTKMDEDGWTLRTQDGSLAAHSELTVAVTPKGPRVLTPWLSEKDL